MKVDLPGSVCPRRATTLRPTTCLTASSDAEIRSATRGSFRPHSLLPRRRLAQWSQSSLAHRSCSKQWRSPRLLDPSLSAPPRDQGRSRKVATRYQRAVTLIPCVALMFQSVASDMSGPFMFDMAAFTGDAGLPGTDETTPSHNSYHRQEFHSNTPPPPLLGTPHRQSPHHRHPETLDRDPLV